jgi:hypothetical protein
MTRVSKKFKNMKYIFLMLVIFSGGMVIWVEAILFEIFWLIIFEFWVLIGLEFWALEFMVLVF